jgi:uncharacterized protein YndB with AHSA1/START domain
METRTHIHEESFEVAPGQMFDLLITPSAIRGWWGAARAIVLPKEGGFWAAAWGEDEDAPDYVSEFTIKEFEPPRRMLLTDGKYFAKAGQPAFELDLTTEFVIERRMTGCLLRVVQDGFPVHEIADDFYNACEVGWTSTFGGIRNYLSVANGDKH